MLLLVELHVLQDALDEACAVARIVDGEVGTVADDSVLNAQNACKHAVEGAHGDACGSLRTHHAGYALLHLVGGFIGEGKGHYLLRLHPSGAEQIGYLGCQHTCLAAACSCDDK